MLLQFALGHNGPRQLGELSRAEHPSAFRAGRTIMNRCALVIDCHGVRLYSSNMEVFPPDLEYLGGLGLVTFLSLSLSIQN